MISLKYQACEMLILHVRILTLPIILINLLNQFIKFLFLLLIILDNSMLACGTILLCMNVFFFLIYA